MTKVSNAPAGATRSQPNLADPQTCGEDVAANLIEAIAIAPGLCDGCADYHIGNAALRVAAMSLWERGSRAPLVEAVTPVLAERAAARSDPVDLMVAACADTGILSTLAHAAALHDDQFVADARFTVLDRCRTPLRLCENFAARHGLQVDTHAVDLTETTRSFSADIILVHNLLPFIPSERHADLIRLLGGWLKDGGRIVMWNPAPPPLGGDDAVRQNLAARMTDIKTMVSEGKIAINEPPETFFARLDNHAAQHRPSDHCYADVGDLTRLIASVGLDVQSLEAITQAQGWRRKTYYVIVAGR